MVPLDTTTTIATPEGVGLRHHLAGPGPRGLAWAVDLVAQGLVIGLAAAIGVAVGVGGGLSPKAAVGALLLAQFVVSWFYGAAFEAAWSGRTPGKALLGLRVVRRDGGPVGPQDALLRNLLRGVDGLPVGYVVGVATTLLDRRLRRLGDLVAGTVVVVERPASLADDLVVDPPVTEEERLALPVGVTLRRAERLAIEGLLARRRALPPARVEELAAMLAPAIAARTGVEAPTALRTLVLAWARATGRDR